MPPRRAPRPPLDDRPTNPNPRAVQIADANQAPYQEVIGLLEHGYSAPEVERAYRLGRETDTAASDILAMRDAGMDWRDIQKALVTVPDFVEDTVDDEEEDARPSARQKAARRQSQGGKPRGSGSKPRSSGSRPRSPRKPSQR